ncbi:MAG: hypothetical protein M0C28_09575 [Candidatus Moduliflexus flocculans]|nr:hypothetical protein [Candidatus Moduliflexus flocculans]
MKTHRGFHEQASSHPIILNLFDYCFVVSITKQVFDMNFVNTCRSSLLPQNDPSSWGTTQGSTDKPAPTNGTTVSFCQILNLTDQSGPDCAETLMLVSKLCAKIFFIRKLRYDALCGTASKAWS